MYLHCSTHNKASTVMKLFNNTVNKFGLPSSVKVDKSVINVDIPSYMVSHPERLYLTDVVLLLGKVSTTSELKDHGSMSI